MTVSPRRLSLAALGAAALFSLACSGLTPTPVPDDKAAYVGSWTGDQRTLVIVDTGSASWENHDGANTSVNGNIVFSDGGFDIGLPPMAIHFTVESEPTVVGDTWTMTINGDVVMTRPATGDEIVEEPADDAGDAPPARGGKAGGGGPGGRGGRGGRR